MILMGASVCKRKSIRFAMLPLTAATVTACGTPGELKAPCSALNYAEPDHACGELRQVNKSDAVLQ